MHRHFVAAVVAIAVLAPAGGFLVAPAQAQTSSDWQDLFGGEAALLRIEVGPDGVLFHVDEIGIEGSAAAELRYAIDNLPAVGNGDGEVTEGERRGFEAFVLATLNAMLPTSFDTEIATLDGKAPYRAEDRPLVQMRKLKIDGAEGSVTSTAPIEAAATVLLFFESVDPSLSVHTARFENVWGDLTGVHASDVPPMEIHVSGYKSWTIDAESVRPAAMTERLQGDTFIFTTSDLQYFEQEGSGIEFKIRGDPKDRILGDAEESPAPAVFAFLLFALAGLALARRRE